MPPKNNESDSKPSLEHVAERVARRREQLGSESRSDKHTEEASSSSDSGGSEASEFVFPGASSSDSSTGFNTEAKTEALVELIGDAPNLLLVGPVSCPTDYDLCTRLITAAGDELSNLLLVTFTESPDKRINTLRGHLGELPENVVIFSVGDSTRGRSTEAGSTPGSEAITIETIRDPTDLQRLGITISRYVAKWDTTEGEALLCFHSLTPLLQAVDDSQRVFRFLNTLFGRCQSANVSAHYHLDPTAHEQELVATFRPMFSEVLTYDETGSVQVDHPE